MIPAGSTRLVSRSPKHPGVEKPSVNSAIVLIISHKASLTDWEQISVRQCVKILGNHPIRFICPRGLDISLYQRIAPGIPVEFVEARWLESYEMFNVLKMSPFLYETYSQYEYILFYEPDAFVFSDQLAFWCTQGLDYVGAPWFTGFNEPTSDQLIGVGNGGFSLRKVSVHLEIARAYETERFLLRGYRRELWSKIAHAHGKIARLFDKSLPPPYYVSSYPGHEDLFWAFDATRFNPRYKVADPREAVAFSFETKPSVLFERNANKLPFGCHGWFKYELDFWRPFIEEFGYVV